METIGLWQVTDTWQDTNTWPKRLDQAEIDAEQYLEDWIEHEPAILERDLVIVARQLRLDGGPLDLLALDQLGRWVLIEIKRGRLRREVIAQAIDYASCLADLDPASLREQSDAYLRKRRPGITLDSLLESRGRSLQDEKSGRDVVIYLVGSGHDIGLERMAGFLRERADLSIRIVSLSAFRDSSGDMILARKIHEGIEVAGSSESRPSKSPVPEVVLDLADKNGVGVILRPLYDVALELGLHARTYATSIMFAPPANKSRCLFVVWTHPQKEPGVAKAWIAPEAFEQFYEINETVLRAAVGKVGGVMLDQHGAASLIDGLRSLLPAPGDD